MSGCVKKRVQVCTAKNQEGSTRKNTKKSLAEIVCQKNCEKKCTNLVEIKNRKHNGIFREKKEIRNLQEEYRTRKSRFTLVLQVGAKLRDNKVNGPEDAIVSEMIKKLSMEKNQHCDDAFSGTGHGPDGILKLVGSCKR